MSLIIVPQRVAFSIQPTELNSLFKKNLLQPCVGYIKRSSYFVVSRILSLLALNTSSLCAEAKVHISLL